MACCGGARSCTCLVTAGSGVTIDGSGSTSNPYVVSSTGAVAATGCGLAGDGSAGAPLQVAAGTWPYACDLEDQGGVIACGSDGILRGEPRSHSRMTSMFFDRDYNDVPVPAAQNQLVTRVEFPFTNPDPCRVATVVLSQEMEVTLNLPPGAAAEYGFGGPDEMIYYRNTGSTAFNGAHWQVTKVLNAGTAQPGETRTLGFDVLVGRGSGGATYTFVQGMMVSHHVV